MGLINLPVELLEAVMGHIILDKWNHSETGCRALNIRSVCSKLITPFLYHLCVLGRANGVPRGV
jgi:hypothetical protein